MMKSHFKRSTWGNTWSPLGLTLVIRLPLQPIAPADLSRALRATLAAIKEVRRDFYGEIVIYIVLIMWLLCSAAAAVTQSEGKRLPQASSPDWENMDSTAIQTEAETSLLLLERRLEKEPTQRVRTLTRKCCTILAPPS